MCCVVQCLHHVTSNASWCTSSLHASSVATAVDCWWFRDLVRDLEQISYCCVCRLTYCKRVRTPHMPRFRSICRHSGFALQSSIASDMMTNVLLFFRIPREFRKLRRKNKIGLYDHQSVQSVAGKLSCRRTALKRCTKIEILWYRKLVSRASRELSEILLPRSSSSLLLLSITY